MIYKKNSNGKIQTCEYKITDNGDVVYYQAITGQINGKKMVSKPKYTTSKNTGRANETSPLEQALSEVQSKIKKKRDAGYFNTIEEALISVIVLPELATKFEERKRSIDWNNVWVSRKIDGLRLNLSNKSALTRTGKSYHTVGYISDILKDLPSNIVLDGELYTDEIPFEELVGVLRREKNTPEELERVRKYVKFYVFDCIDTDNLDMPFTERMKNIKKYTKEKPFVVEVEQIQVFDEETAIMFHDTWVIDGWEGLMLRNGKAPYGLNKRTANLQKMKVFDDAEFKIVGYTSGTGNDAYTVIWKCETEEGETFNARPKGNRDKRAEWYNKGDEYINKMITVRFFGRTENNIPRFPVAISIREDY